MRTHARFPAVPAGDGHYESFYVKAAHPSEPRAVWIRHTIFKAPGGRPVGSLWCTLFDASWERPVAFKTSIPEPDVPVGEYVRIGGAAFAPGVVAGPHWSLTFEGGAESFPYLPRSWMYTAKLPRTKAESLYPAARFSGEVSLGGRAVSLDGWPGMIGHNWGAEHAERWIWLHGAGLDAILGRVRVGRWTLPWLGNGFVELDGVRHRIGGLERARSTHVDEQVDRLRFSLKGAGGLVVDGELEAPRPTLVGWVYSDPGGGSHNVVHSSIADLRLTVGGRVLEQRGGATYELGMREVPDGVPIEPFPDP
jgi:hypothetical protein